MALKLDTSHFTGQRTWSDSQLAEAVACATSRAEVLRSLGVRDCGESRLRVKGHAARLGLDLSRLLHSRSDWPSISPVYTAPAELSALRTAAPSIAMAWFTIRGLAVALPVEPQAYDLLVTTAEGIQRVQVKSTTYRTAHGAWTVSVGRRPYSLDKSAGRAPYEADSLDVFFVINGVGEIYLIPSCVLAGRVGIYLDRYAQYRVGDASSLLALDHPRQNQPTGIQRPVRRSTTGANVSMARSETT